ncbi:MAG: signal recognition particle-docking protein FtsY [Spirochaetes bacterium]|nr:signal recognition particle-docking protein FtsY [Spirochaetota bacterium]
MNMLWLLISIGILALVIIIFIIIFKKRTKSPTIDYYQQSRVAKENLGTQLRKLFGGKRLDEEQLLKLEETLISADIGPEISLKLIEKLRASKIGNIEEAIEFLKNELMQFFEDQSFQLQPSQLNIVLVLGVNGVGKTTSIAKLANYYLDQGKKIMLAAGDTFRAAATEQLTRWANQLNISIVKQGEKADPASVVFDAVDSAIAKKADLLIVDTAGRLHNKKNLIEELKKIERVIRTKGDFALQNMLVIDSTTGQNAFIQASAFHDAVNIDGIVLTKYDAQTKGGIIFTICKKLNIPFYFITDGEKIEDIHIFKKEKFIHKIFD